MVLAAGGTGSGWFIFGIAASAVYVISQTLVVLDKYDARWPLWKASTKPGQIALLAYGVAFMIFCVVGLVATW